MHSAVLLVRKRGKQRELLTAGCGDDGQLGRQIAADSDAERTFQRADIRGLTEAEQLISLSCSDNATFALSNTGRLFATGSFRDRNGSFYLTRNEARRFELAPIEIPDVSGKKARDPTAKPAAKLVQVAAGGNFVLLLTDQGEVLSFGMGQCGELGRLPLSERVRNRVPLQNMLQPSPIAVPAGVKFDRVFAGEFSAFARVDPLRSSARALASLAKASEANGDRKRKLDKQAVESGNRPKKRGEHCVLFVFGLNNRGQLALAEGVHEVHRPTAVRLPFVVEKVAAGQHHTLFLDSQGFVYAIGRPEYGRLGLGSIASDVIGNPQRVQALPYSATGGCVDLAATIENSFAVMRDGSVFSFGAPNSILGLGYSNDDDHEPELLPVLMSSKALEGHDVVSVSAGSQHAVFAACSR